MSDRKMIEAEGVAALHRLYALTRSDTGQCAKIARFLLGLYNGIRFPFDMSELRALDDALFEDCMLVLRMDARVTEREVHRYFEDGGAKFEQMVVDWGVEDVYQLRLAAKRP